MSRVEQKTNSRDTNNKASAQKLGRRNNKTARRNKEIIF